MIVCSQAFSGDSSKDTPAPQLMTIAPKPTAKAINSMEEMTGVIPFLFTLATLDFRKETLYLFFFFIDSEQIRYGSGNENNNANDDD